MSNFKLLLPTDIPWKRVCVTQDMIDRKACDARLPAKWQTSMAVFRYRPDEENQQYPDYDITYLKVTATITGYQPLDKEVQGRIDWNGVNVETIDGLTDLLTSYNPCHGAILQVVVAPKDVKKVQSLDEYPFFLDFEPKKRELYELATDTREKQSRSIESLNVTKSAGSTQSTEILDVDLGGGGFGAQASYAGTGGGFTYTAPNGQWGTKRLNADESLASRSSDVGQEKRETFSFSTQISQMYHLLDSYHLGTNRVVFFIQPRPHTLEEPSGFVRGPRPVEGIQEFFLVVAQPKGQDDFCLSLRLDTSHLTKTPILAYERKSATTTMASAAAPVASDKDIPDGTIVGARACAPLAGCWDVHYHCFRTEKTDSVTYDAPDGFRIEGYNNLVNDSSHGGSEVVVTPNGKSLNINVWARGHKCFEGSEVCIDCPDEIQAYAGSARRQVQVNLVSETPTRKVGEREVLMITTRGLCCCASDHGRAPMDEYIVGVRDVPEHLAMAAVEAQRGMWGVAGISQGATARSLNLDVPENGQGSDHECAECAGRVPRKTATSHGVEAADPATEAGVARLRIRQANELSNYVKSEAIRSLNDPTVTLRKFVDTEFFAKQLEARVVQSSRGRALLARPMGDTVPRIAHVLSKTLGKPVEALTVRDLFSVRGAEIQRAGAGDAGTVQSARLAALGVPIAPVVSDAERGEE